MRAALNPCSGNEKTGPIITWETSSGTCPPTCGQFDRCYAKFHHTKRHWIKLDLGQRGYTFALFLDKLMDLDADQLARGNQWGDQPGDGTYLDVPAFRALVARVGRFRAWSYAHYPLTPNTIREFRSATALGYTVNVSADTLAQADEKAATGLPTVVTIDGHAKGCPMTRKKEERGNCTCPKTLETPMGQRVVVCPAQLFLDMTCAKCGNGKPLCYRKDRAYIIGFRAHGAGANKKLRVIQ